MAGLPSLEVRSLAAKSRNIHWVLQGYSFKMLRPASLTYEDMPWCPGVPEPSAKDIQPIDQRFNSLIILGAQKAGTTWLFDALHSHPDFHGADHGFRCFLSTASCRHSTVTQLPVLRNRHAPFSNSAFGSATTPAVTLVLAGAMCGTVWS